MLENSMACLYTYYAVRSYEMFMQVCINHLYDMLTHSGRTLSYNMFTPAFKIQLYYMFTPILHSCKQHPSICANDM